MKIHPAARVEPFEHHSTPDWDKAGNWQLQTTYYQSAPSGLHFYYTGEKSVLCRLTGSLAMSNGQLVTWWRPTTTAGYIMMFRNQAALGSTNLLNAYILCTAALTAIKLGKVVAGVYTDVASWSHIWALTTWKKLRLSWWSGVTPQNDPALNCELEYWNGSAWVSLGVVYHTNDLWKDNAVNRVGLAGKTGDTFYDDTEIWTV